MEISFYTYYILFSGQNIKMFRDRISLFQKDECLSRNHKSHDI